MAPAQRCQYVDTVPGLAASDCLLDQHHTIGSQHRPGELTELVAQVHLGKRLLKVAPMAVAFMGSAAAVVE